MLDERNLAILALLQADADTPVGEIAGKVNMSISACSRRITQLRADGFIKANVAILDRQLVGVPVTVFVLVKAGRHAEDWIENFRQQISEIPEVLEAHRLAGTFDYIMKLALPGVEGYDHVYKQLVRRIEPLEISGHISMETLKDSTSVPLGFAARTTGGHSRRA
ncbi:MAG: ArsR family transcriptional regulator [Alphaproteobacteria bacterium HGW-Alphaproteobacteria-14]|nr:MAG: ArsR family transcriptional regulator [Alphaproteobacteria bacterium HGW-Alphaproteobacteria-14]